MNSTKPGAQNPADRRPRLSVVVPLVLVCFGVISYLLVDALRSPTPTTSSRVGDSADSATTSASQGVFNSTNRSDQQRLTSSRLRPQGALTETAQSSEGTEEPRASISTPPTASNKVAAANFIGIVSEGPRAEILGRVTLTGTPPPENPIPIASDPFCGKLVVANQIRTTRFYVVDANGGLADSFVYLKAGLDVRPPPPIEPAILDQQGCEYTPYVLGLQTGQLLLVKNSDPLPHNVHAAPMVAGNIESNKFQPAGSAPLEYRFNVPEIFLRFRCDVHPWMFAYVGVVDHPYFCVSSVDGSFRLPNLPAGSYVVEAFHRKAGSASQEVKVEPGQMVTINFALEVPALTQ